MGKVSCVTPNVTSCDTASLKNVQLFSPASIIDTFYQLLSFWFMFKISKLNNMSLYFLLPLCFAKVIFLSIISFFLLFYSNL